MSQILMTTSVASGVQADFVSVLVFILFGLFFAGLALGVAWLVRPANPSAAKAVPYECGELPQGSTWVRFNIRYYLIALFFIVFDVEVIFLYPWAVVFKQLFPVAGSLILWEMVAFISILVIGLAYVWAKGDLNWVKSLTARTGPEEVSGE